jgi:hypothetical protein
VRPRQFFGQTAKRAGRSVQLDAMLPFHVGDVINLNRYRKRVQQQAARELADRNAVRRGRSKQDRTQARTQAQRDQEQLDSHRRDAPQEATSEPADRDDALDSALAPDVPVRGPVDAE